MASRDLKKFLEKIDAELQKSSKEYREKISDVKVHTFYLSLQGVTDHIAFQVAVDGVRIPKRDLDKICKTFFEAVKASVMGDLINVEVFDRSQTATDFSITFRSKSKVKGPIDHLDARKTFDMIKYLYNTPKEQMFTSLQPYYTKSKQRLDRLKFLDLGHANDSSVIKNRINDLLQFGEIPKRLIKIPEIEQLLILRKDDDKGTVTVTLEAAAFNQQQGRTEELAFKRKIQQDIKKAIEKLDVIRQDGSDNAITRTRKKSIKKVTDPFKKRGAKVVTEDTKIDKSSKMPVQLSKKVQAKQQKSKGKRTPRSIPGGPKTKERQSSFNINTLLAILNQRLPDKVAGNMGAPRLENRTGRFASSVRVMDITQTRQGFPSIGYTYQRQPYGVFEATSGSRFADQQRDPRTLIDASIREIAAEYALGRIFTRRV